MSRQRYAERPTRQIPTTPVRTAPPWNVTVRRMLARVPERALGECLAPTPRSGLLVLVTVVALIGVIAVTLSVGNALLVLLAAAAMRVSCERRGRARTSDR